MKGSSGPRTKSPQPSVSANQRINSYALAAGAAGVSLLALAQPAEAEIVYTPPNHTIDSTASFKLDLNHDGITDFVIFDQGQEQSANRSVQNLYVKAVPHNQVNCRYAYCASTEGEFAAALSQGNAIDRATYRRGWMGGIKAMAIEIRSGGIAFYSGDFAYARNNYLGLAFQIKRETHFGWARFSVNFRNGGPNQRTWEAHLTGFAYETVPTQSIKAGQTVEDDADAAVNPDPTPPAQAMALGALALGADGIALWRREGF
jgi:hypothetical protein